MFHNLQFDDYLKKQKLYLKSKLIEPKNMFDGNHHFITRSSVVKHVVKHSSILKSFVNYKPSKLTIKNYQSKKIHCKNVENQLHELGHMLEKFDTGYHEHLFHDNMTLDSRPYTFEQEMNVNKYAYCVYRLIMLNYVDWTLDIPITGWISNKSKYKLISNQETFTILQSMYKFLMR